ncbi:unnamed protein product [Polarella glacialis]|uniref:Uncharacterized protein n=1 Tax=Polarella glacialis TaxID=89957 RepID=A0A813LUU7_POLGL|nr:unnamed protein product [Polarella glacialis]
MALLCRSLKDGLSKRLRIASQLCFRRQAAMISEERRDKMEKQGWDVVGSHSATKLCRWTKSMLQGKGGCYKHTFYGIASHRCMEHTPNVSCANKCVFCWRNHINPVALDWKFDVDDPEAILEESLAKHYATIERQCLSPHAIEERKVLGLGMASLAQRSLKVSRVEDKFSVRAWGGLVIGFHLPMKRFVGCSCDCCGISAKQADNSGSMDVGMRRQYN